ncbi:hypothetical protein ACMXYX_17850 (plasmid) [Neptuniibacter sp. QD72_48]|uniref:hypothetical protein n=1 Tax=Neptuniibacter sp. QD72_48 TaxID=3398214 RepID=UPI0039F57DFB
MSHYDNLSQFEKPIYRINAGPLAYINAVNQYLTNIYEVSQTVGTVPADLEEVMADFHQTYGSTLDQQMVFLMIDFEDMKLTMMFDKKEIIEALTEHCLLINKITQQLSMKPARMPNMFKMLILRFMHMCMFFIEQNANPKDLDRLKYLSENPVLQQHMSREYIELEVDSMLIRGSEIVFKEESESATKSEIESL